MRKKLGLLVVSLLLFYGENIMAFTLTSPAFKDQQAIPAIYTCDGKDVAPILQWQDPPAGTQSFVLIMDDPDATNGVWDHWLVFNIPATATQLTDPLPEGAIVGKNSWNKNAYGGPCPPNSQHHYIFNLYALDATLDFTSAIDRQTLEKSMQGHILDTAKLIGLYKRK